MWPVVVVLLFQSSILSRASAIDRNQEALMSNGSQSCPRSGVRPWWQTGSGCGFDREPGVLILELLRAEIAER